MKVIIVTGTPCTGKTKYAKKLCKSRNYFYFDVNSFIRSRKLHSGFDRKYDSYMVNIKELIACLEKHIKNMMKSKEFCSKYKGIVIDSHLSHYVSPKLADLCVVMKCDLKKLKKRLIKRKYSKAKVVENMDAEIFDICLIEAKDIGHKVRVVKSD